MINDWSINVDWLKEHAKTIAAFVATVLANALMDLINGARPWPQNGNEWLQYLGSAFLVSVGVYGTTNKLTHDQAVKGLPKLADPGSAVAGAMPAMAHTVQQDVTNQVINALPPVVKDSVKQFWE